MSLPDGFNVMFQDSGEAWKSRTSFKPDFTPQRSRHPALITLTVRFMKFRNFFSISVMMEKSPLGRCLLTVVTLI